jgi:hypothetical protein
MQRDIEKIVTQFAADVESTAGSGLRSIVLYGSGASGHHVPGRSDLNLLVVVEEASLALLSGLQKHAGRWMKNGIATPLLVDRNFVSTSTDSYPLEILGMMSAYRVLRGDDPFEGIRIEPADVRLQAERETKAKELLLRRGFLESCGKERPMRSVLAAAAPAIEAILRGGLFLAGGEWRAHGPAFRQAAAKALDLDPATPEDLRALRAGKLRPTREGVLDLFARTMRLLEALSERIENRKTTA